MRVTESDLLHIFGQLRASLWDLSFFPIMLFINIKIRKLKKYIQCKINKKKPVNRSVAICM